MPATVRTRLTIDIDYNVGDLDPSVARDVIQDLLLAAANRLAGDGQFTGDTTLEIERWKERVLFGGDGCVPVESSTIQNWDRGDGEEAPAAADQGWRLKIERLGESDGVFVTVNNGPRVDPAPGLGILLEIDHGRPRMLVNFGEHTDNLLDVRSIIDDSGKPKLAVYPEGNHVATEACADRDGWVGRSYRHRHQ